MTDHHLDPSKVIIVDEHDQQISVMDKYEAHEGGGVLHRAFSVFVVRSDGRILMQQRANGKQLWPLYWSNSCCSHPMPGESLETASSRRLQQELGIKGKPHMLYSFIYQAHFSNIGSEHELCYVTLCQNDDPPLVDPLEIAQWRYMTRREISLMIDLQPEVFSPWFKLEWANLCENFSNFDRPHEWRATTMKGATLC